MKIFMKRGGIVLIGGVAIVSVVFAAVVQGTEAKLQKGSRIGFVDVGGLTVAEAQKKVRLWWETAKVQPLTLTVEDKSLKKTYKASELGIAVDDVASVAQVPVEGLVGQVLGSDEVHKYPVKTKAIEFDLKGLKAAVTDTYGKPTPAKVTYVGGQIVKQPEVPTYTVDEDALPAETLRAVMDDQVVAVPIKQETKKIPDDALDQITEVVSEFSTNFSADNRPRANNIKLASSKLNGVILLPGEKVGFNETVGKRTIEGGYKEAGVYINGRHDTGVGGGICQVSTTLYNASLFANLKIVERTNHSLPVPYVPLGRDATVNYGAQNLVIQNSMDTPIVVCSEYQPGRLTFRILGKKVPGQEVKITQGKISYRDGGTRREYDPTLPAGTTKVIHSGDDKFVQSFRTVFVNGVKVSSEKLGDSFYGGGGTIILYGPKAKTPPPSNPTPPAVVGTTGH
ncbi:MAG: VanW family protein [Armatimonadetes bacterium]|nr:hypothetical protein [Armatimonadota bacterium]MBS1701248.1 VanW family protein [Armatimonadota bacterium]MBS1728508.1 VanW family protein [Armatimonadota bacterium]